MAARRMQHDDGGGGRRAARGVCAIDEDATQQEADDLQILDARVMESAMLCFNEKAAQEAARRGALFRPSSPPPPVEGERVSARRYASSQFRATTRQRASR